MYNVLEKLRRGESLTPKERTIHEQGLVSVLAELHDELDNAVLDAYGWSDLAPALIGKPGGTTPCPDKPAEQAEAEEELLAAPAPLTSTQIAHHFNRAQTRKVEELLDTLVALGQVQRGEDGRYSFGG